MLAYCALFHLYQPLQRANSNNNNNNNNDDKSSNVKIYLVSGGDYMFVVHTHKAYYNIKVALQKGDKILLIMIVDSLSKSVVMHHKESTVPSSSMNRGTACS